ncbi:MAG: hypothetical protein ACJAZO_000782 [Myxococcota bacterium]|jgi:hypothetical protein
MPATLPPVWDNVPLVHMGYIRVTHLFTACDSRPSVAHWRGESGRLRRHMHSPAHGQHNKSTLHRRSIR